MVQKLKLALKSQRLRLVLKAAIFGFFLYFVRQDAVDTFFWGLFFFVTLVIYFRPFFNHLTYIRSLIFLLGLVFIAPIFFNKFYNILVFIFFVLAFYIILALKEFVLVKRTWWHYSLTIFLLYLATLFVSFKINLNNFLILSTTFSLSSFLLMSEFMQIGLGLNYRRSVVVSGVFSFLLFQGFWVVSILPLGFIGVANLLSLGIFMFMDLAINFYTNQLNWRLIWQRFILFLVLVLFIFYSTKWSL